ncbi:MAG TPA: serine protease [Solirubrobacter sp.]|nr:serine protease [Solirubrobacter sp.]
MRKCFIAGLAAAATLAGASTAAAADWAPASSATVHPGVMTYTDGAQCTANFVYTDGAGAVYIGQAAHCSGTGGQTDTDGCQTQSLPNGTPVEVTGASKPGTLVYNSWTAMHQAGETDPDTCAYNDIGLIELDPADYGKVNPSVPTLGGPTGLGGATATGDTVFSYGNSSLRQGVTLLSPKQGVSLGTQGGGWTHLVYTVSPGIPGDSGSGFMDATGRAFGVLSTLQLAPVAGSNGVSDLAKMLAYMRSHGGPDVTLANGTEPFTGSIVG